MKALCWHGKKDIRCDTVPDPQIEDPRDAIIKVTTCAICGSDLHLFNGFIPGMMRGDIVGHEFMGDVVEVGSENDIATAARLSREENAPPRRHYDYSSRSGFPRPASEMRGRALAKKERAQGPLSFEATTRV